MKCELKYIKNDIKEDFRTLGLKMIIIFTLMSIVATTIIRMVLGDFIFTYFSIILSLLIFAYLALVVYFGWVDAVEYCKKNKQGIHRG